MKALLFCAEFHDFSTVELVAMSRTTRTRIRSHWRSEDILKVLRAVAYDVEERFDKVAEIDCTVANKLKHEPNRWASNLPQLDWCMAWTVTEIGRHSR